MSTPYFALYPTDFLAGVGHLGNTELGIYWRLLLVYYRDGRPLPFDTDRLRRIAMTFSPEECRCLDQVVSEFFQLTTEPDGTRTWHHKRADAELKTAAEKHAAATKKAQAAAEARWSKKSQEHPASNASSNAPSMPEAMLQQCQPDPYPYPEVNTHPSDGGETAAPSHPSEPAAPAVPDVPHQAILALWAELLPEARQPAEWNSTRQSLLRTRWREKRKRQDIAWWRGFFEYVQKSDFLMGRTNTPGRRPFLLSLDWLLKADNFLKVVEGAYHSEVQA